MAVHFLSCHAYGGMSIETLHCDDSLTDMCGMLSPAKDRKFCSDVSSGCLDYSSCP